MEVLFLPVQGPFVPGPQKYLKGAILHLLVSDLKKLATIM
jgi:hypothetical protein